MLRKLIIALVIVITGICLRTVAQAEKTLQPDTPQRASLDGKFTAFGIDLSRGTIVEIEVVGVRTVLEPRIILLSPSFTEVANSDDPRFGRETELRADLSVEVRQDGRYTITVSSVHQMTGTFQITANVIDTNAIETTQSVTATATDAATPVPTFTATIQPETISDSAVPTSEQTDSTTVTTEILNMCQAVPDSNVPVRNQPLLETRDRFPIDLTDTEIRVYGRSNGWLLFHLDSLFGWIEDVPRRDGSPLLPADNGACQTLPTIPAFNVATAPVFPDDVPASDVDGDGLPNHFDLCPSNPDIINCQYAVTFQQAGLVRVDLNDPSALTFRLENIITEPTISARDINDVRYEVAVTNASILTPGPYTYGSLSPITGYVALDHTFDPRFDRADEDELTVIFTSQAVGVTDVVITVYSQDLVQPILVQNRLTIEVTQLDSMCTVTPDSNLPVRNHPSLETRDRFPIELTNTEIRVYARSNGWLLFHVDSQFGWIEDMPRRDGSPLLPADNGACQTLPTIPAFNVATAPVFPDDVPASDVDGDGLPNHFDLCPSNPDITNCQYAVTFQQAGPIRVDLNDPSALAFQLENIITEPTISARDINDVRYEVAVTNASILTSGPYTYGSPSPITGYVALDHTFDPEFDRADENELTAIFTPQAVGTTDVVVTVWGTDHNGVPQIYAQNRLTIEVTQPNVACTVIPDENLLARNHPLLESRDRFPIDLTNTEIRVYARSNGWLLFHVERAFGWIEDVPRRDGSPLLPADNGACQTLPTIPAFNVATAPVFPDDVPARDVDGDGLPNHFDLCPSNPDITNCQYAVTFDQAGPIRVDLNDPSALAFQLENIITEPTISERDIANMRYEVAVTNTSILTPGPYTYGSPSSITGYVALDHTFDPRFDRADENELTVIFTPQAVGTTDVVISVWTIHNEGIPKIFAQNRLTIEVTQPEITAVVEITEEVIATEEILSETPTITPMTPITPTAVTATPTTQTEPVATPTPAIEIAAIDRDFSLVVNSKEGTTFQDAVSYPEGDTTDTVTVTLSEGDATMNVQFNCRGTQTSIAQLQVSDNRELIGCNNQFTVPMSAKITTSFVIGISDAKQDAYIEYRLVILP